MEATKWSDLNISIPLLFNFYHGLELTLKGFLIIKGGKFKSSHKLSVLLSKFVEEFSNKPLIKPIEKYIDCTKLPNILLEFCKESSITIDDYYQSLKYPESNNGEKYSHYSLRGNAEDGVRFFEDLVSDIDLIRRESVSLYRSFKSDS